MMFRGADSLFFHGKVSNYLLVHFRYIRAVPVPLHEFDRATTGIW